MQRDKLDEECPELISQYPCPPLDFISKYTDELVEAGLAPLPPDPIDEYTVFGDTYKIQDYDVNIKEHIKTLSISQPQYQIEDDNDMHVELKKLNASIFICIIDLLKVLIDWPDNQQVRDKKLNELQFFFNALMMNLNKLRSHQAIETIIKTLETQKLQKELSIDRFKCFLEKLINSLNVHVKSELNESAIEISAIYNSTSEKAQSIIRHDMEMPNNNVDELDYFGFIKSLTLDIEKSFENIIK